MKNRVYLATAFIVLTLWPLVHIALSRSYGFSPWKLAGWGMYATPFADSRRIIGFNRSMDCVNPPQPPTSPLTPKLAPMIIDHGPEPQSGQAGPAFEIFTWMNAGLYKQKLIVIPPEIPSFVRELRWFRVLNTESLLESALRRIAVDVPRIVAIFDRRFNVTRALVYSEVVLFEVDPDQKSLRRIESFRSDEADAYDRIGKALGCRI